MWNSLWNLFLFIDFQMGLKTVNSRVKIEQSIFIVEKVLIIIRFVLLKSL